MHDHAPAPAPAPAPADLPLLRNRARGELHASFGMAGARTERLRVYEAGGLRLRFPKVVAGTGPGCEAVMINTGGGLAGGDTATLDFVLAAGTAASITSQSAEKVYTAAGGTTSVEARLALGEAARLDWIPQETILFDGARLRRSIAVDLAVDASLFLAESVVFGRLARGEVMTEGLFADRWRIHRGGRLVMAEAVALEGPVAALLDRPALGGGARCLATVLLVEPEAERLLEAARDALAADPAVGAASAWRGMLVVRLLSPSPAPVRAAILRLLHALRGRAAPRVWQ